MEIIFEYNKDKCLYSTDISYCKDILKLKNWKINRLKDKVRIQAIKEFYIENKVDTVPGIISIWHNTNNDKYIIYDVIYRFIASLNNKKMRILLCIYKTNDKNIILNEFKNINKCVPVPEMYINSYNNSIKKEYIERTVKMICEKYPKFISPSNRPNKPNFNRDKFIDLLSSLEIYDDIKDNKDNNILYEILLKCNLFAKNELNNINYPKKSDKYRFWLFNLKEDIIKTYITNECILRKSKNLIEL